MRVTACSLIVTLSVLSACSSDPVATPPPDTGPADAAGDVAPDVAPEDIAPDLPIDVPMDVPMDAPMDVVDETVDASDASDGGDDAADTADVPMDVCPDALADGNCLRCAVGERVCNDTCARPDDPAFGCAGPGCSPCAFTNATAVCSAGACAFARCAMGFSDCNMMTADGCEVPTGTDPRNCGACGTVCTVANGTAGCAAGACTVATCAAGFGDCDGMAANGCETPTSASLAHCGGCGMACAPANARGACGAGTCAVASCLTGFGDCDGMAASGCEVNLQNDTSHCGACGAACRLANATATCTAGACAVMACTEGFADCDRNPANGCEIDLRVSASHCSACNMACSFTNASSVCRDRICGLGTCTTGFTNCDGDPTNGCEIHTSADPNNCGGCGTACRIPNADPACVSGACRIGLCQGNFRDCDGSLSNGCETDVAIGLSNCGTCGTVCRLTNASPVCREGVCNIASCSPGFQDCNGATGDGCEINTQNDLNNCGGCGDECALPHATETCSSGRCLLGTCETGYGNCNGIAADGCEVFLPSDSANCAACGRVCAPGTFCSLGVCLPAPT